MTELIDGDKAFLDGFFSSYTPDAVAHYFLAYLNDQAKNPDEPDVEDVSRGGFDSFRVRLDSRYANAMEVTFSDITDC